MSLEADLGEALRTDYFLVREEFTPAQLMYLERTRAFVHDEVLPVINGYWERAEGLPGRAQAGRDLCVAAPGRPDLELLGQQLPARPRARGVRHPVLERRHHADDGQPAPRLRPGSRGQRAGPAGGGHRRRHRS
jgi:hypothetical protein